MKSHLKVFILSFALISFFSSCEDDVGGPTGPIVEEDMISLELSNEAGFVSAMATVDAGETFSVRLVAQKGVDDLQAITVQENGTNLDISRFTATNSSIGGNPFTLGTDESSSFTKDITITAPTMAGDYTYTFIITDFGNNTDSKTINITVNVIPPTVSYMGSGMIMADLGTLVSVPIMATAGSTPLDQIAVYLGQDLIPAGDIFYDILSNPFPTNPGLIPDSDRENLDRSILIRANALGVNTYTIEITDEAGEKGSVDVEVSTGTAVQLIEGALLNSAGPQGTGGLDLDTGESLGSMDADADIRDLGIDTDMPEDVNWLRQIAGANGAEMRMLVAGENGLSESYDFNDIAIKEQIEGLWSSAAPLTEMNGGDLVTSPIDGGENFVVFNNGNYYLIKIKEVRVTVDDNEDRYIVDIKL